MSWTQHQQRLDDARCSENYTTVKGLDELDSIANHSVDELDSTSTTSMQHCLANIRGKVVLANEKGLINNVVVSNIEPALILNCRQESIYNARTLDEGDRIAVDEPAVNEPVDQQINQLQYRQSLSTPMVDINARSMVDKSTNVLDDGKKVDHAVDEPSISTCSLQLECRQSRPPTVDVNASGNVEISTRSLSLEMGELHDSIAVDEHEISTSTSSLQLQCRQSRPASTEGELHDNNAVDEHHHLQLQCRQSRPSNTEGEINASRSVDLSTMEYLVDGFDDSNECQSTSQDILRTIESGSQEPDHQCLPPETINERNWLLIGAKKRRERAGAGPDLRAGKKSLRAKPNGVNKCKTKTKSKTLGSTQRDSSKSQLKIKYCFDRMIEVKSAEKLVLRANRRGLNEGNIPEESSIPEGKFGEIEDYIYIWRSTASRQLEISE